MKHIDDYSVHDDLPESLNRPNAKELAELWDKTQLKFIDSQISKILIYPVIDELPSDLVDELAIQLHCDFYDKSLSLKARRHIVKTSIAWHRIKGTPAAVEMLTQTIFHDSHTKEWFEYGGRPYFFRMVQDISDGTEDVTRETLNLLKKAIWKGKNVRSWLEMLEFHVHLHEKMDYSEELSTLAIRYDLEDWMPYGNRLWMPERDGSLYRGGAAYRDGEFFRNGSLLHDGMIPGDWPFHHGWDELSMDEMFAAAYISFFDDVSAGCLFRDGAILHGENPLPRDAGMAVSLEADMEDGAEAEDEGGGLSILCSIHRRGVFRRDGTIERGGYACDDDLDGSLSMLVMDRSGGYCRDGDIERAADGRLATV